MVWGRAKKGTIVGMTHGILLKGLKVENADQLEREFQRALAILDATPANSVIGIEAIPEVVAAVKKIPPGGLSSAIFPDDPILQKIDPRYVTQDPITRIMHEAMRRGHTIVPLDLFEYNKKRLEADGAVFRFEKKHLDTTLGQKDEEAYVRLLEASYSACTEASMHMGKQVLTHMPATNFMGELHVIDLKPFLKREYVFSHSKEDIVKRLAKDRQHFNQTLYGRRFKPRHERYKRDQMKQHRNRV